MRNAMLAVCVAGCVGLFAAAVAQTPRSTPPLQKAPVTVSVPKDAVVGQKRRSAAMAPSAARIVAQRVASMRARPASQLTVPRGALGVALTRADYLKQMQAVWEGMNGGNDFTLQWQGANPAEPLSAAVKACVVVSYKFVEASSVKDKSKPGQFINTPAHYESVDWFSYPELLAATVVTTPECELYNSTDTPYCVKNGVKQPFVEGQAPLGYGWSNPLCSFAGSCLSPFGKWAKACTETGGQLMMDTQLTGCAKFIELGPDSLEAFDAVAAANFDSEDKNKDGVISSSEGQYLCRP